MKNVFLFFSFLMVLAGHSQRVTTSGNQPAKVNNNQTLRFTENKGQVSDQYNNPRTDILLYGTNGKMNFHLRKDGISYQLSKVDSWKEKLDLRYNEKTMVPEVRSLYRIDIFWQGTNKNFAVMTDAEYPGYDNYYLNTSPQGVRNVKSFSGVTYKNIYNKIDLHYYGKSNNLKYDYIVSPGGNYKQIKLEVKGAEKIDINQDGSVTIKTPLGEINEGVPEIFQNNKSLPAKWVLKDNVLSFEIENYNPALQLIIDPLIRNWGTYYGNSLSDFGYSCCTDIFGNVFMSGNTSSAGPQIASVGSYQTSYGGGNTDAFLVKFNSSGVRLWGTFYGGSGDDAGYSTAADQNGNVYLSGTTSSTVSGAIASAGSHQSAFGGGLNDAFLAKFDSTGARLWATYYGGVSADASYACCTDPSGNIYIAGESGSSSPANEIGTPGTFAPTAGVGFLAKFNPSGIRQWGTYYGASIGNCASDNNDNIYICGSTTNASTMIVSPGCFQPSYGGSSSDAYLAKFNSSGNRLWGTCYGGNGDDRGNGCSVDLNGNIYLVGSTWSSGGTVIATPGSYQPSFAAGPSYDAFLVKFDSTGARLWGTYYGGAAVDYGRTCFADNNGHVYIGGQTSNSGSIATPNGFQPTMNAMGNGFFVAFDYSGNRLWGSYYGGNGGDPVNDIAKDASGNIYIAGTSGSTGAGTIIASPGSYQPVANNLDAFLAQFLDCNTVPASPTDITVFSNLNICKNNTTTLSVSGAGSVSWYDAAVAGSLLGNGPLLITPVLTVNTTCYAEAFACATSASRTAVSVTVNVCAGLPSNSTDDASVKIFPNPSSQWLNVNADNVQKGDYFAVYNAEGSLVLLQKLISNNTKVDVSGFSSGIYLVRLINSGEERTFRIIKE